MQASAHQAEGLVEVCLVPVFLVSTAKLDAMSKELSDMFSRGHDILVLASNVFFHAIAFVNRQFGFFVNWSTETVVVIASVDIVRIIFGVVDMVFGAVAANSIGSNFKFAGAVAKCHEAEDAEEKPDGFGGNRLDCSNIDGLGIVTKPVPKVDARYHYLVELFARKGIGHGNGEQGIFNVTMAPCWKVS